MHAIALLHGIASAM